MTGDDDYDAEVDLGESIREAFRVIRQRMVEGGPPSPISR